MRTRNDFLAPGQAFQPVEIQPPQPQESERAHLFSLAAGLWLPSTQAAMTGLVIGSAGAVYAHLLQSDQALKIGVAVGIGAAVIAWLGFLARWLALTQPMRLERITGIDLNQDGYIGAPRMVRVEFKADKNRTIYADLPDSPQARQFYEALIRGDKNGIHQWTGKGKPLAPSQYEAIRDTLILRSFARWINQPGGREGWELTPFGKQALRAILAPPPTQSGDDL